jgi:uncharacterized HhH-GPD family protein
VSLHITGDQVADDLLTRDPFALLVGMALDQQFPMERAFAGPAKILDRFGSLDPAAVAAAPADEFAKICATPPAVHRFPGAMAARIQELAAVVAGSYDGNAANLWESASDGSELVERLRRLPSFGPQKAQIFTALLGKQLGVQPPGWQEAAGRYAEEDAFRSVADVVDKASLDRVREFKKRQKSAAKG